ncbi:UNVERIFIED_CONTAM: UDP-glucose flavonoid 3-O-glucosyltransferase 6 [Sesamum angustifolium]|uniref:UDP-glucose flavonoid 3-O-glucosyltransferase 6 n=1 Tax=Sesamum angustifolium TaxID=2727405 RepID=A0AAW2J7V2_9LAMI
MSEAKTLTSLVFIPLPIISHMVSAVKLAKLLADRDERLSITILVMKLPMEGKISSLTKTRLTPDPGESKGPCQGRCETEEFEFEQDCFRHRHVLHIHDGCRQRARHPNLRFPAYWFGSVGLMLHLQSLRDDHNMDLTEYKNLDAEICVSAFTKPVPAAVWPPSVF